MSNYCAFGKTLCRGAVARHEGGPPLSLIAFPPLVRQATLEYAQRNGVRLSPGRGAGVLAVSREAALRVGAVLLVALHVLRLQRLSSLSSNSARRRICGPCNDYFVVPARAGAPQFTLVSFAAVAAAGAAGAAGGGGGVPRTPPPAWLHTAPAAAGGGGLSTPAAGAAAPDVGAAVPLRGLEALMAAAAAGSPAAAAAAAAAPGPATPAPRAARAAAPAAASSDDDESDGLDVDAPHPGGMAAAAAAAWGAAPAAAAGSGGPPASPVGAVSPAGGPTLVSPPLVRSAVSKRGCAFRDIDGHACGGTSHKVTAKVLLAVYLRAVYIADAETAAALHEYMHPERADLFVCTVGRDICTATRVDFDEAEREIAKKQAAVKAMRDARAHGTMSAADAAAVVADVAALP